MSNAYLDPSQRRSQYDPQPSTSQRPYSQASYGSYSSPPSGHYDRLHPLAHESPDDRDEPFDVRADFDGDGPRWSDLYGPKPKALLSNEDSRVDYDRLDSHVAPSGQMQAYAAPEFVGGKTEASREELVSVPVLGPEWHKAELHEMSRRGQSELRQEKRARMWTMFRRDQGGLCGIRWLTRRLLVFSVFFLLVGLGITLYFVIPRAPSFTFYEATPFTVDNSTVSFSRSPTNFSFAGNLNLYADSSSNYLPIHFKHLQATVYDLDTLKTIATGDWGSHTLPKGEQEPVILPVQFSYSALNQSDTAWNTVYDACGHIWSGTVRPDLKFRLELKMSIVGLVSKPFSQTQISDVACPFELPADGV